MQKTTAGGICSIAAAVLIIVASYFGVGMQVDTSSGTVVTSETQSTGPNYTAMAAAIPAITAGVIGLLAADSKKKPPSGSG